MGHGVEGAGGGYCTNTKILDCQTEDFSSSVVLSAAVWKQTPQQAGPGPPSLFLKQSKGYVEGRVEPGHTRLRVLSFNGGRKSGCSKVDSGRRGKAGGSLSLCSRQLEGSHSL